MGVIHPANLETPLSNGPFRTAFIPDHLVREVLIESIIDLSILVKCIGLKSSSKSGISILISLKSLLGIYVLIRVNDDWLMVRKMNSKAQNTGLMIMHLKEVKSPICLTATNVL